jgi:hypothetical protein
MKGINKQFVGILNSDYNDDYIEVYPPYPSPKPRFSLGDIQSSRVYGQIDQGAQDYLKDVHALDLEDPPLIEALKGFYMELEAALFIWAK